MAVAEVAGLVVLALVACAAIGLGLGAVLGQVIRSQMKRRGRPPLSGGSWDDVPSTWWERRTERRAARAAERSEVGGESSS